MSEITSLRVSSSILDLACSMALRRAVCNLLSICELFAYHFSFLSGPVVSDIFTFTFQLQLERGGGDGHSGGGWGWINLSKWTKNAANSTFYLWPFLPLKPECFSKNWFLAIFAFLDANASLAPSPVSWLVRQFVGPLLTVSDFHWQRRLLHRNVQRQ